MVASCLVARVILPSKVARFASGLRKAYVCNTNCRQNKCQWSRWPRVAAQTSIMLPIFLLKVRVLLLTKPVYQQWYSKITVVHGNATAGGAYQPVYLIIWWWCVAKPKCFWHTSSIKKKRQQVKWRRKKISAALQCTLKLQERRNILAEKRC